MNLFLLKADTRCREPRAGLFEYGHYDAHRLKNRCPSCERCPRASRLWRSCSRKIPGDIPVYLPNMLNMLHIHNCFFIFILTTTKIILKFTKITMNYFDFEEKRHCSCWAGRWSVGHPPSPYAKANHKLRKGVGVFVRNRCTLLDFRLPARPASNGEFLPENNIIVRHLQRTLRLNVGRWRAQGRAVHLHYGKSWSLLRK